MFARCLSTLGSFVQFATASVLLALSFLIQHQSIAAHAGPSWLATTIAALLVVSRVLAVFNTSHCYMTARWPSCWWSAGC